MGAITSKIPGEIVDIVMEYIKEDHLDAFQRILSEIKDHMYSTFQISFVVPAGTTYSISHDPIYTEITTTKEQALTFHIIDGQYIKLMTENKAFNKMAENFNIPLTKINDIFLSLYPRLKRMSFSIKPMEEDTTNRSINGMLNRKLLRVLDSKSIKDLLLHKGSTANGSIEGGMDIIYKF